VHRHLEKLDKNARHVLNAVYTVIKKNPLKTPRDLSNAVCTAIWKNQVKPPGSPGFLSHEGWKNQAWKYKQKRVFANDCQPVFHPKNKSNIPDLL
jgi:hypothetical protein